MLLAPSVSRCLHRYRIFVIFTFPAKFTTVDTGGFSVIWDAIRLSRPLDASTAHAAAMHPVYAAFTYPRVTRQGLP